MAPIPGGCQQWIHILQSTHTPQSFLAVGGTAQKGFTSYPLPETINSTSHTEKLQSIWDRKEKNSRILQEKILKACDGSNNNNINNNSG